MSQSISIGWLGPQQQQWAWILEHFRNVIPLSDTNVQEWIEGRASSTQRDCRSCLVIAIDSRFDRSVEWLTEFTQRIASSALSALPVCILLGEDWVGHRRTFPLPDSIQTFYWYELYDRVLPLLRGLTTNTLEKTSRATLPSLSNNDSSNKRKISVRVQSWIDSSVAIEERISDIEAKLPMALVVAYTASTRQLWCEAFAHHRIQSMSTTPDNLSFWVQPNVIVLDLECEPLSKQSIDGNDLAVSKLHTQVAALANQFPDATLVVADAFPRWESWRSLHQLNADILIPKPFCFTGLLDTLASCVGGASCDHPIGNSHWRSM
jgi:hypothetical protein